MTRAIADVLGDLNRGCTYAELNEALAAVVAGVKATGKSGTLVFKLKISPNGKDAVEIEDEITTKMPAPARPKTLMFIDADNSLRRTDPRQKDLPLSTVGGGAIAPPVAADKAS